MKATVFKEVGYSLSKLIEDIDMGEIGLPDIQRPFIWSATKVRDLFDSMYKGFPVGYLLFWENGLPTGHKQIGTDSKDRIPRLLIVDGQQRLTSLYSVLKGKPVLREDYTAYRISISFRPRDGTFEVADAAIRKDPEFIPDISELWAGDTPRRRFEKDFISQVRKHRELSDEEEDQLHEAVDHLYDLHSYPFTVLELSSTVDEEQVAEVFVRINSQGVTLKQADFILTLMSVFWDEGRSNLERFCRASRQPSTAEASPFNHFINPDPDQLLRVAVGLGFRRARLQHVYSVLRGKDMQTEEFSDERRVEQFDVLKRAQAYTLDLRNWHEFMKCLIRAGYRGSSMISSRVSLLYSYAMFLIGKRDFNLEPFKLRELIARWFFMTALTGRYTTSPESTMEQDLARLRSVKDATGFADLLNGIVGDALTEDFWSITLPNELATASARSPSAFAYYAALNLLDARVLFSKMKVSELLDPSLKPGKSPIERHHLYARNYLAKTGVTDMREVNQIANFALVEWLDNIDISDAAPSEYVPKRMAKFTKCEVEDMWYWHALPAGWERMEYQQFLDERRRLMAKVIRDGFARLDTGDSSRGWFGLGHSRDR